MDMKQRIGDYEILDELGSGGMGRVYRVRNVISDRIEAMKVLLPDLAGRQDLAARFLREIKVLAALNHPNIAALRTALTADNQLVMIMEFVDGQSVANRLAKGPIATGDALNYIDQVLDALSYAHAQHVIHRDIKPANMMLTPRGIVKLTDFGIARSASDQTITVAGTTTGSLSYMSPEQVNGDATDPRSDLYSVGVSLYEMVTGVRPFQADSDFALMLAHVKQSPRPPIELQPGLAPGLNDIILKAIAKNPADRFPSADAFRQALRTLPASGLGQSASANATVLASATAPTMAAASTLPAPPPSAERASARSSTDHPRTLIDTRTPSAPRVPTPAGAPPNLVVQALPKKPVHPGLYMALGGVLAIATLIGMGAYVRREGVTDSSSKRENASGGSPTPAKASPAPAPTPAPPAPPARDATSTPQPAATTPAEALPATASATRPPAPSRASQANKVKPATRPANVVRPAAAGGTAADTPAAQPSTTNTAELDQLEQEIDGLAARATAVNNSLDHLQQEQARQGLGLRGDMAARQQSMKSNLAKAQDALEKGDAARARRFSDQAQKDIDALEQFLGR
jgi:serine/threonine-protein kinase